MDGTDSRWSAWRPLLWGAVGSMLHWLAQPPLGWSLCAWLAPVAWGHLILLPSLPGKRPYGQLWFAGVIYWLLAIHWICFPHPALTLGWLALSAYLGVYLPLFVGLSRVAVLRLGWPLNVSAAVVWTGLEIFQANFLSGFHMAALAHTQVRQLAVIQIADLGGGYFVSFLMLFVGASLVWVISPRKVTPIPLAKRFEAPGVAGLLLIAALAYGQARRTSPEDLAGKDALNVLLVQGSIEMRVVTNAEEFQAVRDRMTSDYRGLTKEGLAAHPETELVIWPETMVPDPLVSHDPQVRQVDGNPVTRDQLEFIRQRQEDIIGAIGKFVGKPTLVGIDRWRYTSERTERFNSVVLIEPDGRLGTPYDKMQPVIFGEYIPFAKSIPWLYRISPLTGGIESGTAARNFEVVNSAGSPSLGQTWRLCPNICYESALSHVVRDQVAELRARGSEPDVLVNQTNDGWFRGSAELDMHLACGIFRAVECRKPFLIAANTGISAWIDGDGQVHAQGPKQANRTIAAQVMRDPRTSLYVSAGDIPAGLCTLVAVFLAGIGFRDRRRQKATQESRNANLR